MKISTPTMIALGLGVAAVSAYALAAYGRSVVTKYVASNYEIEEYAAADTAASLTFFEAVRAGARALGGALPIDETEVYVAR